jgi:hypothetical protein
MKGGMKAKSKGHAVMVSGLVSRCFGLRFHELHEHSSEGYWTAGMLHLSVVGIVLLYTTVHDRWPHTLPVLMVLFVR